MSGWDQVLFEVLLGLFMVVAHLGFYCWGVYDGMRPDWSSGVVTSRDSQRSDEKRRTRHE